MKQSQIVKPPVERSGEGIKLATAADPEGNLFSLAAVASQR
jgi:predicted enzyme related to lactoylglutathione lyase